MSHEHGPASRACREVFAQLSAYLDAELDDKLCSELTGHLEDCPPCVAFLESLRRTVKLVETAGAPPLPEEIARQVREAYARLGGAKQG